MKRLNNLKIMKKNVYYNRKKLIGIGIKLNTTKKFCIKTFIGYANTENFKYNSCQLIFIFILVLYMNDFDMQLAKNYKFLLNKMSYIRSFIII